jgi:uncharacterized protein Veg
MDLKPIISKDVESIRLVLEEAHGQAVAWQWTFGKKKERKRRGMF